MFGSVAKTYYAKLMNIDPKDIFVVSAMPCTAKKFEAERFGHTAVPGLADIDAVITVRELARMIKKNGIMFNDLPDDSFDAPFGLGSGAGTIFGATGGVMEAALRTGDEALGRAARAAGLYADDKALPVRKSHENPDIKRIYEEFFGKPNSHLAHEILHTAYTVRKKY